MRVEFSEDDYHEEDGIINADVALTGMGINIDSPNPITVRITALTPDQFQSQRDSCSNPEPIVEPADLDQGEGRK